MNVVRLLTAPGVAALAVVRLSGDDAATFVTARFGSVEFGRLRHGDWTLTDGTVLDDPLVRGGDGFFDVNLHGGRRIVEKFIDDALAAGFVRDDTPPGDAIDRWLPHATTVDGLRLLLVQRDAAGEPDPDDLTLVRLLVPATLAIVGPANAGKSTLSNRLAGTAASLVSDVAGTTRDWVETPALICDGKLPIVLADTPGRRVGALDVEAAAIGLSAEVVARADVVVRLLDATRPDDVPDVGRSDVIDVWNKADLATVPAGAIAISAVTGDGVADVEALVAERLGVHLNRPTRRLGLPQAAG